MDVNYPGSGCALTAPSLSRMTSLTSSVFVNVIANLDFTLLFNHKRQHSIIFLRCLST